MTFGRWRRREKRRAIVSHTGSSTAEGAGAISNTGTMEIDHLVVVTAPPDSDYFGQHDFERAFSAAVPRTRPSERDIIGVRPSLDRIFENFLTSQNQYLVLEAGAGMGKTTFALRLSEERGFALGIADDDPRIAIASICGQLTRKFALDSPWGYRSGATPITLSTSVLRDTFYNTLAKAASKSPGPLIVILDGLTSHPSPYVNLLPKELPPGVRMVLSQQAGSQAAQYLAKRETHLLDPADADNQSELKNWIISVTHQEWARLRLREAGVRPRDFASSILHRSGGVWMLARIELEQTRLGQVPIDDSDPPRSVWKFYQTFLESIRTYNPSWTLDNLLRLCTVISSSPVPLTLESIEQLLGPLDASPSSAELIGSSLAPLLRQDSSGAVSAFHGSMRDFLAGTIPNVGGTTNELALQSRLKSNYQHTNSAIAAHYARALADTSIRGRERSRLRHLAVHHMNLARDAVGLAMMVLGDLDTLDPEIIKRNTAAALEAFWEDGDLSGYFDAASAALSMIGSTDPKFRVQHAIGLSLASSRMSGFFSRLPTRVRQAILRQQLWPDDEVLLQCQAQGRDGEKFVRVAELLKSFNEQEVWEAGLEYLLRDGSEDIGKYVLENAARVSVLGAASFRRLLDRLRSPDVARLLRLCQPSATPDQFRAFHARILAEEYFGGTDIAALQFLYKVCPEDIRMELLEQMWAAPRVSPLAVASVARLLPSAPRTRATAEASRRMQSRAAFHWDRGFVRESAITLGLLVPDCPHCPVDGASGASTPEDYEPRLRSARWFAGRGRRPSADDGQSLWPSADLLKDISDEPEYSALMHIESLKFEAVHRENARACWARALQDILRFEMPYQSGELLVELLAATREPVNVEAFLDVLPTFDWRIQPAIVSALWRRCGVGGRERIVASLIERDSPPNGILRVLADKLSTNDFQEILSTWDFLSNGYEDRETLRLLIPHIASADAESLYRKLSGASDYRSLELMAELANLSPTKQISGHGPAHEILSHASEDSEVHVDHAWIGPALLALEVEEFRTYVRSMRILVTPHAYGFNHRVLGSVSRRLTAEELDEVVDHECYDYFDEFVAVAPHLSREQLRRALVRARLSDKDRDFAYRRLAAALRASTGRDCVSNAASEVAKSGRVHQSRGARRTVRDALRESSLDVRMLAIHARALSFGQLHWLYEGGWSAGESDPVRAHIVSRNWPVSRLFRLSMQLEKSDTDFAWEVLTGLGEREDVQTSADWCDHLLTILVPKLLATGDLALCPGPILRGCSPETACALLQDLAMLRPDRDDFVRALELRLVGRDLLGVIAERLRHTGPMLDGPRRDNLKDVDLSHVLKLINRLPEPSGSSDWPSALVPIVLGSPDLQWRVRVSATLARHLRQGEVETLLEASGPPPVGAGDYSNYYGPTAPVRLWMTAYVDLLRRAEPEVMTRFADRVARALMARIGTTDTWWVSDALPAVVSLGSGGIAKPAVEAIRRLSLPSSKVDLALALAGNATVNSSVRDWASSTCEELIPKLHPRERWLAWKGLATLQSGLASELAYDRALSSAEEIWYDREDYAEALLGISQVVSTPTSKRMHALAKATVAVARLNFDFDPAHARKLLELFSTIDQFDVDGGQLLVALAEVCQREPEDDFLTALRLLTPVLRADEGLWGQVWLAVESAA